jgi:cytochrome c peroxidase
MNPAKVQLGRYLFYDKRMSINGTTSCSTCHRQELAFTDGRPQSVGATGQVHPRNAISLANVAWEAALNWSDTRTRSLEEQALKPMFSEAPLEMGLGAIRGEFLRLIETDPVYRPLFRRAFPGVADVYSISNIARALAAFERTIISSDSPYDRFHFGGDPSAISEAAKRGEILFFEDGGPSCFRCHSGINFSDSTDFAGAGSQRMYHNTGLYNLAGMFSYPEPNRGLFEQTKLPADMGKFKTPGLRNVALTAPYMHDGSIATLGEVLDHYAAGGRTVSEGPLAGVGHDNPHKDKLVHGFPMTPVNRSDLIAFLESLTDDSLIHNAALADPWPDVYRGRSQR